MPSAVTKTKPSKPRRLALSDPAADMVQVTADLPKLHHDEVKTAARDEGRSIAGQIRFIVRGWVAARGK